MRPEMVLTDTEKSRRFRKVLAKKKKAKAETPMETASSSSSAAETGVGGSSWLDGWNTQPLQRAFSTFLEGGDSFSQGGPGSTDVKFYPASAQPLVTPKKHLHRIDSVEKAFGEEGKGHCFTDHDQPKKKIKQEYEYYDDGTMRQVENLAPMPIATTHSLPPDLIRRRSSLFRAWEEPRWIAQNELKRPIPIDWSGPGQHSTVQLRRRPAAPCEDVLDLAQLPQQQVQPASHHQEEDKAPLRHSFLVALSDNLRDFEEVATLQANLLYDKEDAEALASHNRKLYLNYVTGRFLTATDGWQRLLWLRSLKSSQGKHELRVVLECSSVPDVAVKLKLFYKDDVMRRLYLVLASSLESLIIDPRCKALVAKTLFFYQGSLKLNAPMVVIGNFFKAIQELQQSAGRIYGTEELYDMMRNLDSMAPLFEHSGFSCLPGYSLTGPLDRSHGLCFTSEEALWLKQRREDYRKTFASVGVLKMAVRSTIDFMTKGVPLDMTFVTENVRFWGERIRRFHKSHEEFTCLSDIDQAFVYMSSFPLLFSLIACMLDCSSVLDQVRMSFLGHDLEATFPPEMLDPRCRLRPIRMTDFPLPLPPEYHRLMERVKASLKHPQHGELFYFALFFHLMFAGVSQQQRWSATYTSPSRLARWKRLRSLRARYELAVSRCADAAGWNADREREAFTCRVRRLAADVDRMTEMMPRM